MNKKLKVGFFVALFLGYVVAQVFMGYNFSQNKEAQRKLAEGMQSVPAEIFWPALFLFTAFMSYLLWQVTFGMLRWQKQAAKRSVVVAKNVASSLWIVEESSYGDDFVVLSLKHFSFGRHFILAVRPGHPDVVQFRNLKEGDVVEFFPLETGMECALPHELCGFLRLKSVNPT